MSVILELLVLFFALIPAALFCRNLRAFRRTPQRPASRRIDSVSVLIPARNEERTIAAAVRSVLASRGIEFEVVVLDDHSTDATAEIVRQLAGEDSRVRLMPAPPLPDGWCGKQHACSVLAEQAAHPLLYFMDADVRLSSDALARMAAYLTNSNGELVSGFPHQETRTFLEHLLLPLIHFILLGFLPLDRMRRSTHPAYAAGCGQLMLVRRDAYKRAGGHAAIRSSLHDGIQLPKAFRAAGYATDIFDATDLASCRMYQGARQVWNGLAKNATEGLGHPARVGPFTLILIAGQVAPFVLLVTNGPSLIVLAAAILAMLPRVLGMYRFRQPLISALLHPVGILLLLAVQWYALTAALTGRRPVWKGRSYAAAGVLSP